MRVYLQPPQPSRGLQRIADALVKYKPEWVEVVDNEREAELVVIYAIGRRNAVESQAIRLRQLSKQYAVIQVCLRSTMTPMTKNWRWLWDNAVAVWSYYDLDRAIKDDGGIGTAGNFYHAPLGVEAGVFRDYDMPKHYVICSSGLSRLSESVRECHLAAEQVGKFSLHLGPDMHLGRLAKSKTGLIDKELAINYSACEFVSALRRKEGFELPAAEGLCCGARPIAFDTPDYRWAYKSWAEYIREGTRQEVIDQLVQLFKRGARPVTQDEIDAAREWFHWPTIVGGFYERLR